VGKPVLLGGSGDGEATVAAWSVHREPVAGTPWARAMSTWRHRRSG